MWIFQESSVEDENSDEEEEGQDKQTVTNTEAVDCFKKRLTWMERENNVALFNCSTCRMMEFAMCTHCSKLKQLDLLQHFRLK